MEFIIFGNYKDPSIRTLKALEIKIKNKLY